MPDKTKNQTIAKNTDGTMELFGCEAHFHIDVEIDVTVNIWHPQGVGGRMEDAVEGDKEVVVNSVDMFITIYEPGSGDCISFNSSCMKTFDEHFEVEANDAE